MAWTTPRDWVGGEFVTESIMDTHVRDNLTLVPHFLRKTADESVVSSTTPQDDDHLTFSIAANEVWSVQAVLWHSSASGTPHFRYSFAAPASATFHLIGRSLTTGGVFQFINIRSAADNCDALSGSTFQISFLDGVVVNAGTAGSARVTWAQAVSNATATVLKQNSHMFIARLA